MKLENYLKTRLVSQFNKMQNLVSTLTTKAEYIAFGSCCAQILQIENQPADYMFEFKFILIFCDKTSVIAITHNPILHFRTKHIDIRHHFIKEIMYKMVTLLCMSPNR